jgi:hypothetical protein
MKKSFFWWDYSYFFEMNYEWLKYASKNFEEKGHAVNNEKVARRMLIASEICKRIADDDIADNAEALDYLSEIIRKYSLTWWD